MTRKWILKIKVFVYNLLADYGVIRDVRPIDYYVSKVSDDAPWIYCAYIASVFYHLEDEAYLNAHQNKREAIEMVRIWNQLGYNVYVQDADSQRRLPSLKNVKIVFGLEPKMMRAMKKYKAPINIYYSTGAYFEHANRQVCYMTDLINRKYNAHLPYRRLQEPHNAFEKADKVLMIGSRYTLETVPEQYRKKVCFVHQSAQTSRYLTNLEYAKENEFFFMASYGNMLRGVPLLIDYFTQHQAFSLHIVGPIEQDYYELIKSELTPNIKLHGFIDINSDEFLSIVSRCNFMIYPSGSEGFPGSVLNGMKNGLIPLVTRWAAFDDINQYGFLMDDWSVKSIEKVVERAISLAEEDVVAQKKRNQAYVLGQYSLNAFCRTFQDIFSAL